MEKLKKILKIVAKILQILGIGAGTAALSQPEVLQGILTPEQISALAGAAAVVNAFLPSVLGKQKQGSDAGKS
jgi:hypothetical protein